jgi:hypothetical protein
MTLRLSCLVTNWSSNPLNRILSSSIGVISIASDWLSLSLMNFTSIGA